MSSIQVSANMFRWTSISSISSETLMTPKVLEMLPAEVLRGFFGFLALAMSATSFEVT